MDVYMMVRGCGVCNCDVEGGACDGEVVMMWVVVFVMVLVFVAVVVARWW